MTEEERDATYERICASLDAIKKELKNITGTMARQDHIESVVPRGISIIGATLTIIALMGVSYFI